MVDQRPMKSLAGQHVLITAGPTYEAIDPVRFLGNRSSGRLGYALARNALRRGAKVTLISGPSACTPPAGATLIRVESAREMLAACQDAAPPADIIIMAAAVADYRPARVAKHKIKKSGCSAQRRHVELVANPDILATLGNQRRPEQYLVGFALETQHFRRNALAKLSNKNCDMIIANLAESINAPAQAATIFTANGATHSITTQSKAQVAAQIWRSIVAQLEQRTI